MRLLLRPSLSRLLGFIARADFETKLIARSGFSERLTEELCNPNYVCRPINLSGNTDCYQPLEATYQTTRRLLELLLECRHPVTLVTKSTLVLRDLELLAEMAEHRLVARICQFDQPGCQLETHLRATGGIASSTLASNS